MLLPQVEEMARSHIRHLAYSRGSLSNCLLEGWVKPSSDRERVGGQCSQGMVTYLGSEAKSQRLQENLEHGRSMISLS